MKNIFAISSLILLAVAIVAEGAAIEDVMLDSSADSSITGIILNEEIDFFEYSLFNNGMHS